MFHCKLIWNFLFELENGTIVRLSRLFATSPDPFSSERPRQRGSPHRHDRNRSILRPVLATLLLAHLWAVRFSMLTRPLFLSIPLALVVLQSGPALPRIAAGSDVLPPAKTSSSAHVSPAALPSSPAVVAGWLATNCRTESSLLKLEGGCRFPRNQNGSPASLAGVFTPRKTPVHQKSACAR